MVPPPKALFIVLQCWAVSLFAQKPEWVVFDTTNSLLPHNQVQAIGADTSYVWVGTANGLARYDGTKWTTYDVQNSELPEDFVLSVAVDTKGNTWAGTLSGGVAVFRQGGVVTNAPDTEAAMPGGIAVLQNFPNPFNGTTTIRFSLPAQTVVSLKVFDLVGREVSTLKHGPMGAGVHTLQWDAPLSSSGVYYCRLHTPAFTKISRLAVLR